MTQPMIDHRCIRRCHSAETNRSNGMETGPCTSSSTHGTSRLQPVEAPAQIGACVRTSMLPAWPNPVGDEKKPWIPRACVHAATTRGSRRGRPRAAPTQRTHVRASDAPRLSRARDRLRPSCVPAAPTVSLPAASIAMLPGSDGGEKNGSFKAAGVVRHRIAGPWTGARLAGRPVPVGNTRMPNILPVLS